MEFALSLEHGAELFPAIPSRRPVDVEKTHAHQRSAGGGDTLSDDVPAKRCPFQDVGEAKRLLDTADCR